MTWEIKKKNLLYVKKQKPLRCDLSVRGCEENNFKRIINHHRFRRGNILLSLLSLYGNLYFYK